MYSVVVCAPLLCADVKESIFVKKYDAICNKAIKTNINLDTIALTYCQSVSQGIVDKLKIINNLLSLKANDGTFETKCLIVMAKAKNSWYDPSIPSEKITIGDICHAYKGLFGELHRRNITDFKDASIYSYVMIYQLYLNSMEEQIFSECVDQRLMQNPVRYCNRTILANLNVTLWNEGNKKKACEEGARDMTKKCKVVNMKA